MPEQFGVPQEIVADVASGRRLPSVYSPYLAPIHSKHVIGINNAYQIGIWIDVLFFGDNSWYLVHKNALARWPGIKITCSPRFDNRSTMEGIKYVPKDHGRRQGITRNSNLVSWNANSGAAAISLAVHFGAKRIVLLGFDMCLTGGVSHWHGAHKKNKKAPPFKRHLRGFPEIAQDAKKMGVEIINASPKSEITVFRKASVGDLLMIDFVKRLENLGRQGISVSICHGPSEVDGKFRYFVNVMTAELNTFEESLWADSLKQCLDIVEKECRERGWIK